MKNHLVLLILVVLAYSQVVDQDNDKLNCENFQGNKVECNKQKNCRYNDQRRKCFSLAVLVQPNANIELSEVCKKYNLNRKFCEKNNCIFEKGSGQCLANKNNAADDSNSKDNDESMIQSSNQTFAEMAEDEENFDLCSRFQKEEVMCNQSKSCEFLQGQCQKRIINSNQEKIENQEENQIDTLAQIKMNKNLNCQNLGQQKELCISLGCIYEDQKKSCESSKDQLQKMVENLKELSQASNDDNCRSFQQSQQECESNNCFYDEGFEVCTKSKSETKEDQVFDKQEVQKKLLEHENTEQCFKYHLQKQICLFENCYYDPSGLCKQIQNDMVFEQGTLTEAQQIESDENEISRCDKFHYDVYGCRNSSCDFDFVTQKCRLKQKSR